MPDLESFIAELDTDMLFLFTDVWGINDRSGDLKTIRHHLFANMSDSHILLEIIDSLPANARECLEVLSTTNGNCLGRILPANSGIRQMGRSRREREHPNSTC